MARGLGVPPGYVTKDLLVTWFAGNAQWKRETRRSYRSSVSTFFKWAHKSGRLCTDPAEELPLVKADTPAPRPAPDRVWREALLRAEPRVMIMLRLAAEAGLRRGEVAQVHTRDLLDGVDGYTLLVHGKGDKDRIVPISDDLAALIAAGAPGHTPEMSAYGADGWLFPGDDNGHLSPRYVGKLCAEAMPAGWTIRALRHRFATRAYRGSRNIRAVQTLLGHSSIAVTERYIAVDDSEVRAAMMAARDPKGCSKFDNGLTTLVATVAACMVVTTTILWGISCEKNFSEPDAATVCYTTNNSVTVKQALDAARNPHTRLLVGSCSPSEAA